MKVNDSTSSKAEQALGGRENAEVRHARRRGEAAAQAAEPPDAQPEAPAPQSEHTKHFNQVKNRVKEGNYVVDSYAVAGAFLRDAIGAA